MYVFSSITCSHCNDFHKFTLPKLERDFISKGLLKFVYVHFPSDSVTMRVAKLSYCIPPEKFYDFIGDLYDNSRSWMFATDESVLESYAKKFGLSDSDIKACKDDKKLTSDILLIRNSAYEAFSISVTPTIVIEANGKREVMNAKKYDELKQYLETMLNNENDE
jgi:protein-disulfide isomerase